MKPLLFVACVAVSIAVSACMVREERTVQPAAATAVVTPAPANVIYTDTPKTTTTTVYTR